MMFTKLVFILGKQGKLRKIYTFSKINSFVRADNSNFTFCNYFVAIQCKLVYANPDTPKFLIIQIPGHGARSAQLLVHLLIPPNSSCCVGEHNDVQFYFDQ